MRKIIVLGGGGFSMKPENPLLDWYILRQEKRKPNNVAASSRTNAKAYRLRKTNKEWKKSNGNDVFRRRRTSMSEYLIVKKQKLEPAVEQ